jgi:hypothetical protein
MPDEPAVRVQHWALATVIWQHGSNEVFDLLEVRYDLVVPPDTEFPRWVSRLDMFLRVFAEDAGPTRYRVRVFHQTWSGRWDLRKDYDHPRQVLPLPVAGEATYSGPVRLANVSLGGTGVHAIVLFLRPDDDSEIDDPAPWNPDPTPWEPDEPGWTFGAVEYIYVVR